MFNYRRIQELANRSTGDAGKWYLEHRSASMKRIRQALSLLGLRSPKVLIAGVGNANDLDLPKLQELSGELWLADIDGLALENTVNNLGLSGKVHLWIGDAGASVEAIDFLRMHAREKDQLTDLLSDLQNELKASIFSNLKGIALPKPFKAERQGIDAGARIPETDFDLVVSQCLLSQIHWPLAQTVWELTALKWEEGQGLLFQSSEADFSAWADDFLRRVIRELARSLVLITKTHLKWLDMTLKPEGIALVNTDVSWRGIPLYGTDIAEILADFQDLENNKLYQVGKTDYWTWQLDKETKAKVGSTVLARAKRR